MNEQLTCSDARVISATRIRERKVGSLGDQAGVAAWVGCQKNRSPITHLCQGGLGPNLAATAATRFVPQRTEYIGRLTFGRSYLTWRRTTTLSAETMGDVRLFKIQPPSRLLVLAVRLQVEDDFHWPRFGPGLS